MKPTRSFITVCGISPEVAKDFSFDYDTSSAAIGSDDLMEQLVPNNGSWGDIGWMELEDYEYEEENRTMLMTIETKWEPPTEWARVASRDCPYFQNRLITMSTIARDECWVEGNAFMDGEPLQYKRLLNLESSEVFKYYDEENEEDEVDDLDALMWDAINKFEQVCRDFYLGEENNG